MKSLNNENEVHEMADSPYKRAMQNSIHDGHANLGVDVVFDVVADCGGNFHLLEEGDDPKAVVLCEDVGPVDLTDLEARCYEYVELSGDGKVFVVFQATNDAGGPCFFIPNEPWIGDDFRQKLAVAARCCSAVQEDETEGGN